MLFFHFFIHYELGMFLIKFFLNKIYNDLLNLIIKQLHPEKDLHNFYSIHLFYLMKNNYDKY